MDPTRTGISVPKVVDMAIGAERLEKYNSKWPEKTMSINEHKRKARKETFLNIVLYFRVGVMLGLLLLTQTVIY